MYVLTAQEWQGWQKPKNTVRWFGRKEAPNQMVIGGLILPASSFF
jgi:hypothetical protein